MRLRTFDAAAAIPYLRIDGGPNARHLVVTFPKLEFGGAPPRRRLREVLEPLDVHELCLGSDPQTFVGPAREQAGVRTARRLIRKEAERLGVPRENVIAVGSSMGAVCALYIGFGVAGRIVAGGPPVRMGTQLARFAEIDGPTNDAKAAAADFIALADNGDGRAVEFLDRMVARGARKVREPTAIELVVSRRDRTYSQVRALERELAALPLIDVSVVELEYPRHADVAKPFADHLREALPRICGTAPRPLV